MIGADYIRDRPRITDIREHVLQFAIALERVVTRQSRAAGAVVAFRGGKVVRLKVGSYAGPMIVWLYFVYLRFECKR